MRLQRACFPGHDRGGRRAPAAAAPASPSGAALDPRGKPAGASEDVAALQALLAKRTALHNETCASFDRLLLVYEAVRQVEEGRPGRILTYLTVADVLSRTRRCWHDSSCMDNAPSLTPPRGPSVREHQERTAERGTRRREHLNARDKPAPPLPQWLTACDVPLSDDRFVLDEVALRAGVGDGTCSVRYMSAPAEGEYGGAGDPSETADSETEPERYTSAPDHRMTSMLCSMKRTVFPFRTRLRSTAMSNLPQDRDQAAGPRLVQAF